MSEVRLLSEPTNYAVVQLPGRACPGVVFQGDSLDTFIAELEEAAITNDLDEQRLILRDVVERLKGVQSRYESVLSGAGIELPYNRSSS